MTDLPNDGNNDPHNVTSSWPAVTSLDSVLQQWASEFENIDEAGSTEGYASLKRLLLDREDNIATILRLAGTQFGAMPGFVAEVIVLSGLGTPPSQEEREAIHESFHRDYAQLQEFIRGHMDPE